MNKFELLQSFDMAQYKVTVYKPTVWSFFTQADHYEEYILRSDYRLDKFAAILNENGFSVNGGTKWSMPGAILMVELM